MNVFTTGCRLWSKSDQVVPEQATQYSAGADTGPVSGRDEVRALFAGEVVDPDGARP